MAQLHYKWYDELFSDLKVDMKQLHLENNHSISLTNDHFIYVQNNFKGNESTYANNDEFKIMQASDVKIGDYLYYYEVDNDNVKSLKVINITNSEAEKRAIYTLKPFVLINNVIASPYIGPEPICHYVWHFIFKLFVNVFGNAPFNQIFFSIGSLCAVLGAYSIHCNPIATSVLCGIICAHMLKTKILRGTK